jgi:hypothetical protein
VKPEIAAVAELAAPRGWPVVYSGEQAICVDVIGGIVFLTLERTDAEPGDNWELSLKLIRSGIERNPRELAMKLGLALAKIDERIAEEPPAQAAERLCAGARSKGEEMSDVLLLAYSHTHGWTNWLAHVTASNIVHGVIYGFVFRLFRSVTLGQAAIIAAGTLLVLLLIARARDRRGW